jgi:hypothetical protein
MTTPLITATELKNYSLPISDKQWDLVGEDQIDTIIEYASQNIMDYVDLGIASAYYTERIPGNNRSRLMLDQYPLLDVQSITAIDHNAVSTSWSNTYFLFDSGAALISWKNPYLYKFDSYYDWQIQYRAGWETIPGPIKHATALQCVQMLQPVFRGGANFSEVKLIDGLNESIVDMLEKYKRKRIG